MCAGLSVSTRWPVRQCAVRQACCLTLVCCVPWCVAAQEEGGDVQVYWERLGVEREWMAVFIALDPHIDEDGNFFSVSSDFAHWGGNFDY